MEHCSTCQTPLAPADVLYTTDARVTCAACHDKVDLVDTDKRAATNIVRAATGALAMGMLSVVLLLFIAPVAGALPAYGAIAASIGSGVVALRAMMAGNERFTKLLTEGQSTWVYIGSILGFVFCALTLIIVMFLGAILR